MKTTDLLNKWSTLSLAEIETQLESAEEAKAARKLYGAAEVRKMRGAERAPRAGRGGVTPPLPAAAARAPRAAAAAPHEPVVLLPGIMGSLLSSIRGVTDLLWINPAVFLQGRANLLDMNADGTGDEDPAVEIVPVNIEKIFYLKAELRLRKEADLYEFPYDWRRPIEYNAGVLRDCLERWAGKDGNRKLTLLGHSMGGIVSRAYLTRYPRDAERRLKRVITLGTPYFGAAGAIENMINGNDMMATAQALNGGNVPQRMLLSFPSVYQLLPAPPELFPAGRPYPANWDIYKASEWRSAAIRQDFLDQAREFHASLHRNLPDVETVQIAGCNFETTTDVERTFDPADEKPGLKIIKQGKGPDAGDATVPLWSSVLPGAKMYYVNEKHRYLPGNDDVLAGVLELLYGDVPKLATAIPPPKPGLFGVAREVVSPEAEAAALRARLEEGTASQEDLGKLYFAM